MNNKINEIQKLNTRLTELNSEIEEKEKERNSINYKINHYFEEQEYELKNILQFNSFDIHEIINKNNFLLVSFNGCTYEVVCLDLIENILLPCIRYMQPFTISIKNCNIVMDSPDGLSKYGEKLLKDIKKYCNEKIKEKEKENNNEEE